MNQAEDRNTVLQQHLALIVDRCKVQIDGLQGLVLYGGYGHGEGSWYRDAEGWHPYNDYDLVAVVNKPVADLEIERLRKALALEVGIQWVDLTQTTVQQLQKLKPSIRNYDLKYASRVLLGNAEILDLIPAMSADKLPIREALTLFLTRQWTFLGGPGSAPLGTPLAGEEARFFRNQLAKALLAAVDARLLVQGRYHASYRERVNRVIHEPTITADRVRLYTWALEEKLFPQDKHMTGEQVLDLYDSAHAIFLEELFTALSRYYNRPLATVGQIARIYRNDWEAFSKGLVKTMLGKGRMHTRKRAINLAQMYLVGAYRPGGDHNMEMIRKAVMLLGKFDPSLSPDANWDSARNAAARLRLEH